MIRRRLISIIKFKKTTFCILMTVCLMTNFLYCYGENATVEEGIVLSKYPAYFSQDVWNAISSVWAAIGNVNAGVNASSNDNFQERTDEKIVVIMDSPVKYVRGLAGRNDNTTQGNINKEIKEKFPYMDYAKDPNHGTAVASLIASKPERLPCSHVGGFSSKVCNESKMVVVGVTSAVKMVNTIYSKELSEVEDIIIKLGDITAKKLTDEEKEKTKNFSRIALPVRRIFNFSIGGEEFKERMIQDIKDRYQKNKSQDSDEYFIGQWLIDCIENNMRCKEQPEKNASVNEMDRWRKTHRARSRDEARINEKLREHYSRFPLYF